MIIDSLTEIRTYRENADDMCDSCCLTVVKNEKKIVLPLTSLYNLLPLLVSTTLFLAEKKIPQIGQPKQCPNKIYLLAVFIARRRASQPARSRSPRSASRRKSLCSDCPTDENENQREKKIERFAVGRFVPFHRFCTVLLCASFLDLTWAIVNGVRANFEMV